MSLTEFSPPPLQLCGSLHPRISTWLCEDKHWPIVHTIYPFLVYMYIRDYKSTLLLAFIFESIEALAVVFLNDILLDKSPEMIGDTLISDILMANLGIVICMSWTKFLRYPYQPILPSFKRFEWGWIIYTFQLILL